MSKKKRPTIAELEKMLNAPGGEGIHILPNGEIRVGEPVPDSPPRIEDLMVENQRLKDQVESLHAKVVVLEKIKKLLR